jgi:hypothetical protein
LSYAEILDSRGPSNGRDGQEPPVRHDFNPFSADPSEGFICRRFICVVALFIYLSIKEYRQSLYPTFCILLKIKTLFKKKKRKQFFQLTFAIILELQTLSKRISTKTFPNFLYIVKNQNSFQKRTILSPTFCILLKIKTLSKKYENRIPYSINLLQ